MSDLIKTIIRPQRLAIPRRAVLRRLGHRPGRREVSPTVEKLLDETTAAAEGLLSPAGIFADLTIREVSERQVTFVESPLGFESRRLARHLEGCYRSTLMVCTLGPGLDEALDRLQAEGETTRALILDAIGSETAELLAESLNQIVSQRAAKSGSPTRRRFSPGYTDWPLSEQAKIFSLLKPESIGVELTEAFMMVPQKSISAVIGWERPAA